MSYDGLCSTCESKPCCKSFAAPLVFSKDLIKLKSIGKDSNYFLDEIIIKGKNVKRIKKKSDSRTCVFFDEKNKRCSIYQERPLDCKFFPFDIYLINDQYHWIVYSCNPDSNWKWTETHLEMFENDPQFNEIMENIETFSDLTEINSLETDARPRHAILRKVKWKSKKILNKVNHVIINETRCSI